MLEKFDAPGVQQRQQVMIDIGLGTGRLFENDTLLPKASLRPLAPIPVADNARDAEAPEDCGAFCDRAFGIKGRAHFKKVIQRLKSVPALIQESLLSGPALYQTPHGLARSF